MEHMVYARNSQYSIYMKMSPSHTVSLLQNVVVIWEQHVMSHAIWPSTEEKIC